MPSQLIQDQVIDESEPGALAQSGAAQPPDESQEEASSAVGSLDTEISQNAPAASERLNAAAAKRLNQLLHKAIREVLIVPLPACARWAPGGRGWRGEEVHFRIANPLI